MIGFMFWLLCIISCTYSFLFGSIEGKLSSTLIFTATIATHILYTHQQWYEIHLFILVVDLFLLIFVYFLSLHSTKNWLLWMSGFLLVGVATHLSPVFSNLFNPRAYELLQGFWSIPVMLTMALGIFMNRTIHEKSKRRWVGVNK